ncbi:MAG TPA: GTPase Era [Acidimicrobiia bacterium]|nr:GTPase Era [Acidimicrobiia bacterium]
MPEFRSGFVSVVGRPNAGKSTLVNQLVGTKVTITSERPQTTRTTIRGVRDTPTSQLVLLDTPGLHRPRTTLGQRTNERARAALTDVDVIALVMDASTPIGPGDRYVADLVHDDPTPVVLDVNKTDIATPDGILTHLADIDHLGEFDAYVPCSARTGEQVDVVATELEARLPPGPRYYPEGTITDQPETFIAAELVREQLLLIARDELPHSIAVTVEPLDPGPDPVTDDVVRLLVTIGVERDSQKGLVIGHRGATLKTAVTAARHELEALLGARVYLQTRVRVDRDWQRRPDALDRLGL